MTKFSGVFTTLGICCTLHAPKFELIFQQGIFSFPSDLVEMARGLCELMLGGW